MKGLIYKEEIISTRNTDIVSLVWKLTHSVGSLCVFMSLDQKAETEINGHENLFQFLRQNGMHLYSGYQGTMSGTGIPLSTILPYCLCQWKTTMTKKSRAEMT